MQQQSPGAFISMPMVIENTPNGERGYDIFSRLLKDRIIMLNWVVNDAMAATVTAQLLYLEAQDAKKPVHMYLNSPGGSCTAGLAIYDTMQAIKPPVYTYCIGQCASMGAVLLSSGAPGHRYASKNSRIMIHEVSSGQEGKVTDLEISLKESIRINSILMTILSQHTGKTVDQITQDCKRDMFMSPTEAIAYGLVDKVIKK